MALPLPDVQSAADCTSFSRTVLPFLPQLQTLPARLSEAGWDLDSLKEVYLTTNPLVTAIALCLSLAALFFVVSEVSGNYSQVDRSWSILPSVYNVHFALWARMVGIQSEFLDTIAMNTLIWSVSLISNPATFTSYSDLQQARLTYNYWRKGGYRLSAEDYRWEVLRVKINNRFVFFLFNVVFISLAQSVLLLLINTPTYVFMTLSRAPTTESFGIPDVVFSRLVFFFIILEHFADQQQWQFHRAKHTYHATARIADKQFTQDDLERGFVVSGFWSLSRHPNFVAEQAIWLSFYLWSCFRTENYLQWTGLGIFGYLLIFQASTRLTESISASKYPEYKDYQARVGRFIPRPSVEPKMGKRAGKDKNKDKAPQQEETQKEGKKSD
ncbi:DUF1295 domain protein [Aspergillus sp. HF37]|nr:DUF1295 domain protein [Aspergillus sp. HF37]